MLNHLPPPCSIVHEQRHDRANALPFAMPVIKDDERLYHGSEYASLLADNDFKMNLIKYLSNKFLEFSVTVSAHVQKIVIDSPAFSFLVVGMYVK